MGGMFEGSVWPAGSHAWERCGAEESRGLGGRLAREVKAGHPLFGLSCVVAARSRECDDVLVVVEMPVPRMMVVHLTWSKSCEPPFPCFVEFESWAAWAAAVEEGA